MNDDFQQLYSLVQKAGYLDQISELLHWDSEINSFPKKNANQRVKELSILSSIQYQAATNPEIGRLCAKLEKQNLSEEQQAFVREASWDYQFKTAIPEELNRKIVEANAKGPKVWEQAKKNNDFSLFAPFLEETIRLHKEYAKAINPDKPVYEALFSRWEYDFPLEKVNELFSELREFLVPLVDKISTKPVPEKLPLTSKSTDELLAFNKKIAAAIGYDFDDGMLELSSHPFTSYRGRMTTRFTNGWFEGLMATLHEGGHGIYEQNLLHEHRGTPLGSYRSLLVHESQSRFWENIVGRSKEFSSWLAPQLRADLDIDLPVDELYRRSNIVSPSLTRVEADEVTYSLHVLLRFELEQELFNGEVAVNDLPRVWNDRMQKYLGVTPETDSKGVLQDVHWSCGLFAYFPTYALGNMLASQLYDTMKQEMDIPAAVQSGNFSSIESWLKEHIHEQGRKYSTDDLIKRTTGKSLEITSYKNYLEEKYGDLYNL